MIFGIEPIDIAKEPYNWYLLSREFYVSAKTLICEKNKIDIKQLDGKIFDEEILLKNEISKLKTPIIFNFSFAIELILKAILLKYNPNKYINNEGKLKFNHKTINVEIFKLGIKWNQDEKIIINNLVDYVTFGKYPSENTIPSLQHKIKKIKPFDMHANWFIEDAFKCFEILNNIYIKLTKKYITF